MTRDRPPRLADRARAAGAIASLALAAVLILRLTQVELALHLYVVVIGILAGAVAGAAALSGLETGDPPSPLGRLRARGRRRRPERARSLEEIEHAVDFSRTTAFDVYFRLRPHLVRIAAHRLAANRGISIDDVAAARDALGPVTWELVSPDRPPPADRHARGLDIRALREVVDSLEAL